LFSEETKFPLVQFAGQVKVAALCNSRCRTHDRAVFRE